MVSVVETYGVFKPFYQRQCGTSVKKEGLILGLYGRGCQWKMRRQSSS
jgi:hypothetical protein